MERPPVAKSPAARGSLPRRLAVGKRRTKCPYCNSTMKLSHDLLLLPFFNYRVATFHRGDEMRKRQFAAINLPRDER